MKETNIAVVEAYANIECNKLYLLAKSNRKKVINHVILLEACLFITLNIQTTE